VTVHLDRDRLDREMGVRGLTGRDLSKLSGVGEATISRARHGGRVTPATMRKLAAALASVPEVPGAATLIDRASA
jgi:transcriptional regulator with XRE-family HTH domain